MISEKEMRQLKFLCDRYNIKYRIFPQTDILMLDSGLDQWMIKYFPYKERPYCLYHKNKIKQTNKYHVQRHLRTIYQSLDVVVNHKKVLVNLYGSPNTYKKYKYNNKNNKRKYT